MPTALVQNSFTYAVIDLVAHLYSGSGDDRRELVSIWDGRGRRAGAFFKGAIGSGAKPFVHFAASCIEA